jgi:hypothetical protein
MPHREQRARKPRCVGEAELWQGVLVASRQRKIASSSSLRAERVANDVPKQSPERAVIFFRSIERGAASLTPAFPISPNPPIWAPRLLPIKLPTRFWSHRSR